MKKILIVVDYQNDFANTSGVLYVPNAENIYKNIQNKINDDSYDDIIYTFDTHEKNVYSNSDESKIFPLHCEYNTFGWNLYNIKPNNNMEFEEIINNNYEPKDFKINNEFFFVKDQFNIWDGNKNYEKFFINRYNPNETIIDVVGVATNYCVFTNIMGMIDRGYNVNIIEDSIEGIKNFPDGTIDDSYIDNIETMKKNKVLFK